MTMMIGVVLSKNINEEDLNIIRKDTELALIETNNDYINKQLKNDEAFFQATSHGIDSKSGIGAYDLYTKDLTSVCENITKENRYVLEGILEIRKGYYSDVSKWINIIKKIKNEYRIPKFGIIYFNAYTTSDKVKIDIEERKTISLKEISIDILMKLEKNKLVFFE